MLRLSSHKEKRMCGPQSYTKTCMRLNANTSYDTQPRFLMSALLDESTSTCIYEALVRVSRVRLNDDNMGRGLE